MRLDEAELTELLEFEVVSPSPVIESIQEINDELVDVERTLYYWAIVRNILMDIYNKKIPILDEDIRSWLTDLHYGVSTIFELHQQLCNKREMLTWKSWQRMLPKIRQYTPELLQLSFSKRREAIALHLRTNMQKTIQKYNDRQNIKARNLKQAKTFVCLGASVTMLLTCCLCAPCIMYTVCHEQFSISDPEQDQTLLHIMAIEEQIRKTLHVWDNEFMNLERTLQLSELLKPFFVPNIKELIVGYLEL